MNLNAARNSHDAGQPILTEDVLAEFPDEPRSTVFYRLNAELKSGNLAKFDHGIYYIPEKAELFGRTVDVPLDPERVIERKYLKQDGEVIGFVSGLALENRLRVSNQVPAVLSCADSLGIRLLRGLPRSRGFRG